MATKRIPLWRRLVEEGLFPDRERALSWIMMGKVYVRGDRVSKAGSLVRPQDPVSVKGLDAPFVGRGGIKLREALARFALPVQGSVALDVGASTGGFTDCLLAHGARLVYAVDVGYGQLAGKLRADPRVVNLERVNVSDLGPEDLDPPPSLATIDVSYLSLRVAVPIVRALLRPGWHMACLVKPLFEVEDRRVRRSGRIADPSVYRAVLRGLATFFRGAGCAVRGVCASPITGAAGSREFFIALSDPEGRGAAGADGPEAEIEAAVEQAAGCNREAQNPRR